MEKQTYQNEAYVIMNEQIDVLNYVTLSSTREQREKFNIGDIFINAAVCLKCKTYIRSKNARDLKRCACGAVAVDGGSHYARRLGKTENMINIIESFYDAEE